MGRKATWITGIICVMISGAVCFYPEYYVEDLCRKGDETIIYKTSEVGSAGTLKATSRPPYKANKNCTVVIQPPPDQGIVLSIRKIDMREMSYCQDYIKIFHSDIFTSPAVLCRFQFDLLEETSFYTKGPMTIVYHVGPGYYPHFTYEEGFTLTYTTVSEDVQDCTADNMFMCSNGRCIPKTMTCDGRNNCGNRNDESHIVCDWYGVSDYFNSMDAIYVVVFSLLIFSLILTCIMVSRRRRRRSIDASLVSDNDEMPTTLPPFQAVHPTGFGICQNPAGPRPMYSPHKAIQQEGGFANPCYPNGMPVPPPPYSQ